MMKRYETNAPVASIVVAGPVRALPHDAFSVMVRCTLYVVREPPVWIDVVRPAELAIDIEEARELVVTQRAAVIVIDFIEDVFEIPRREGETYV